MDAVYRETKLSFFVPRNIIFLLVRVKRCRNTLDDTCWDMATFEIESSSPYARARCYMVRVHKQQCPVSALTKIIC